MKIPFFQKAEPPKEMPNFDKGNGYVAHDFNGQVLWAGSCDTHSEAIKQAKFHCPKDKSWQLIHVRLIPRPVVYEHVNVHRNIPTQNDPNKTAARESMLTPDMLTMTEDEARG